jgi:MYXO-CTERM domain-containing protein
MGHKKFALIALLVTSSSVYATTATTVIGQSYQSTQGGGPFRYAYATTLNGTPFDASTYNPTFQPWGESWSDPAASAYLLNAHNFSGVDQTLGSSFYSKDGVELHPGSIAEFSVLRYIVPVTGYYSVVGTFSRADMLSDAGNGVAVSVGYNGSTIWDNNGNNIIAPIFGSSLAFNLQNMHLAGGDNLYFFVGRNGTDYSNDLTNLTGTITFSDSQAAPEPSTYALGLTGLAGLFFARRRRA